MRDRTLRPAATPVKPEILPVIPSWAEIPDDLEACPRREDEPDDLSIGGTTVAAILGASSYRTPWDVWAQLTGRVTSKHEKARGPMLWGTRHEPTIIKAYGEDHNPDVTPCAVSYRLKKDRHLRLSPDALAAPSVVVDAKTARWRGPEWGEDGSDGVPASYLIQVTWYCRFLRRKTWAIPALFGGSDDALFTGEYDAELGDVLEEQTRRFYRDHVIAGVPPEPEAGALVTRYLSERFPRALSKTLEPATDSVTEAARQLAGWKLAEKYVAARKEEIENALKLRIGSGAGFAGDGFKVRWTDVKQERTDWKAAFAALAEAATPRRPDGEPTTEGLLRATRIINANTTQSEYRRFTLHTTAEEQARAIEAINPRLQLPPTFVGDEKG